jgi:site-specific recombinase XerD
VLRHSFAVRQVRRSIDLSHVQRWLGHMEASSTEVYKGSLAYPEGIAVG